MRTRIAYVVIVALAATACQAAAPDAASPQPEGPGEPESNTLRVAFSGQPDFNQIMNYKWLEDLRDEHGIEAEALIFEGTSPPFRAMVSGEADIVVGQVPPGVLLVHETDADIKMIAGDVQRATYFLVSTPEIQELTDLYGKKVGTAGAGAVSDSLTQAALEAEGIDLSQIEFVQIGGTGARMAALLSNQVQAGAAHAAEAYEAVGQGLNDLLPIGEAVGPYLFHGAWARTEWLEANPNLAQLAIDEFIESVRWAADDKDEYIEVAKEHLEGLSDESMSRAYDLFVEIDLFAENGGLDEELIQATIDLEQDVGNLPADMPPAEEWVERQFVDSYLERHGER